MRIREYATQQFEQAERADRDREAAIERRDDRERVEKQERANIAATDLLARSPIIDWFPGARWDWLDDPDADSLTLFTSGVQGDPFRSSIPILGLRPVDDGSVEVIAIIRTSLDATETRVGSAVDVGRFIREELDPALRRAEEQDEALALAKRSRL